MNRAEGVVVRVEGEWAWVRADAAVSACGACARREGCSQAGQGAILDGMLAQREKLVCVQNTLHARPGDAVTLASPDGRVLRAAALVYGLPLLLAFAGAMFLGTVFSSDGAAFAGMLAGLSGGFLAVRFARLDAKHAAPVFRIESRRVA